MNGPSRRSFAVPCPNGSALFTLTGTHPDPSLARNLARTATREQAIEFIVHRSVYTLKEADPHS
ncbi:hypothetical protein [Cryobacterium sp. MDB2-33-2]|uniref:hypothetical protein n=1 Tax=Cryobacterium sp. MDB2-33-2 TaxID=1259179 RepID=UPI0032207AEE